MPQESVQHAPRARGDRRRGTDGAAPTPRYRHRGWLGVYAQPVLLVAVMVPFGLFSGNEPPDSWLLVATLVVVVLASVVPCVWDLVDQYRTLRHARPRPVKGTWLVGRLAWRLLGWGLAHSLLGLLAVAAVSGAPGWSDVAAAAAMVGLAVAAAVGLGGLVWLVGVFARLAWRFAHERRGWPGAVVMSGLVAAFCGALAGIGPQSSTPDRLPRSRGIGSLAAYWAWSFTGDGPASWMWVARLGSVLMAGGLAAVLCGVVAVFVLPGRGGGEPEEAPEPAPRPAPGPEPDGRSAAR